MSLKNLFTVIFLVSALNAFSQTDNMFGEYFLELENEEHQIEYRLLLNPNGTFIFHSYTKQEAGIPTIAHKYGKGTWAADGQVVTFLTDKESDFDEKHTLDLSDSRARFITKPSRDKTDRVIKTRLKFFDTEILWIKGLDIYKK